MQLIAGGLIMIFDTLEFFLGVYVYYCVPALNFWF